MKLGVIEFCDVMITPSFDNTWDASYVKMSGTIKSIPGEFPNAEKAKEALESFMEVPIEWRQIRNYYGGFFKEDSNGKINYQEIIKKANKKFKELKT